MLSRGNENFRAPGENRTRDLPNSIFGNPGAASRDDAIFSGNSLL